MPRYITVSSFTDPPTSQVSSLYVEVRKLMPSICWWRSSLGTLGEAAEAHDSSTPLPMNEIFCLAAVFFSEAAQIGVLYPFIVFTPGFSRLLSAVPSFYRHFFGAIYLTQSD